MKLTYLFKSLFISLTFPEIDLGKFHRKVWKMLKTCIKTDFNFLKLQ